MKLGVDHVTRAGVVWGAEALWIEVLLIIAVLAGGGRALLRRIYLGEIWAGAFSVFSRMCAVAAIPVVVAATSGMALADPPASKPSETVQTAMTKATASPSAQRPEEVPKSAWRVSVKRSAQVYERVVEVEESKTLHGARPYGRHCPSVASVAAPACGPSRTIPRVDEYPGRSSLASSPPGSVTSPGRVTETAR